MSKTMIFKFTFVHIACVHVNERGSSQPYLVCRDHSVVMHSARSHSDWSSSHLELCVLLRADVHPVALMCVIGLMNGQERFDWQKQMACWQVFTVVPSVDTLRAESC